MGAFVLVDDGQRAIHGDGTVLAGFEAFLAADAADRAILAGLGTRPFVLAFDGIGIEVLRDDFDQLLGAGLDTEAAGRAFRRVDMGDPLAEIE